MKHLITILLLVFSSVSFAQNWSPILVNEKMNYQHSDSAYISHTIWVESITPQGNDTIYELNKIVIDCPGESEKVLRNRHSFLQKNMIKQDSGKFLFSIPNSYLIKTKANMWDTWIFDQSNNITATVNGHSLTDVLGIPDSVKYIGLSDGNQIRISKNFGIIKFPDFATGGYYELVGIQDTEYGESVIDFWDIFDFEVGDVFQYDYTLGDASWFRYETRKLSIYSKEIYNDSIKYLAHKVIDGHTIDYSTWEQNYYSNSEDVEICFIDSLQHPVYKYNYEIVTMWEDYWGFDFYHTPYSKVFISRDSLDINTKTMGSIAFYPEIEHLYNEISPYNDTLLRILNNPENLLIEFKEGLGRTIHDFWDFESIVTQYLVGYVKNGDTVGIITPDYLLLTDINTNNTAMAIWIVYPNPASDKLFLSVDNSQSSYNFELRNIMGQLIKKEKKINSSHHSINISDLKAGVYFYLIKEKGIVVQQGKLIKK